MATRREELDDILREAIGTGNVYYQPPEKLKMRYPAIRYNRDKIYTKKADNTSYHIMDRYQVIVIDTMPDNPAVKKLLELPMSSFVRSYTADNLHHDILTIFF